MSFFDCDLAEVTVAVTLSHARFFVKFILVLSGGSSSHHCKARQVFPKSCFPHLLERPFEWISHLWIPSGVLVGSFLGSHFADSSFRWWKDVQLDSLAGSLRNQNGMCSAFNKVALC